MENVQNPVEAWIAVVAQHYFFAIPSNFCRKTGVPSTPFDGKPLAPQGKMRYNILDTLTCDYYNPWRFFPYAKEERIQRRKHHSLKGADRVRKRPGVIFGSDGLEGCEHAVFEILSNSIDEAREGHGSLITVTRYQDRSVQVEAMGRGCPVDWNEKEGRYN